MKFEIKVSGVERSKCLRCRVGCGELGKGEREKERRENEVPP